MLSCFDGTIAIVPALILGVGPVAVTQGHRARHEHACRIDYDDFAAGVDAADLARDRGGLLARLPRRYEARDVDLRAVAGDREVPRLGTDVERRNLRAGRRVELDEAARSREGDESLIRDGREYDAVGLRRARERDGLCDGQRARADDADAGGVPIDDPNASVGCDGDAAGSGPHDDLSGLGVGDGVEDAHRVVVLVDEPHAGVRRAARLVGDGRRAARLRRRERQVDRLQEGLDRRHVEVVVDGERQEVDAGRRERVSDGR
jgi:hypothetical protein